MILTVSSATIPADVPAEALAPAVAAAVAAQQPDVVLLPNRPAERVWAGAIAAKLNAPVLTGVKEFQGSTFEISRYGGITIETTQASGPVVIIMDGLDEAGAATLNLTAEPYQATITGEAPIGEAEVNLAAAERIVGVGRGFRAKEDLQLARDLAATIGAQLGSTRPLAEGSDWMPKSSYMGVSGQVVAPELYIALGISGQAQHTIGLLGSGTIVVVNDDPDAPYFSECDYGVVGDLYEVVPALTKALQA